MVLSHLAKLLQLTFLNVLSCQVSPLFRDKYCEVLVWMVKEALKHAHSELKDLQIQALIRLSFPFEYLKMKGFSSGHSQF